MHSLTCKAKFRDIFGSMEPTSQWTVLLLNSLTDCMIEIILQKY